MASTDPSTPIPSCRSL